MSTPNVVADTLALAAAEGLRVTLLPVWYDIDDIAALNRLAAELHGASDGLARHTQTFFAMNSDLLPLIAASQ
jgi:hypothetical protein